MKRPLSQSLYYLWNGLWFVPGTMALTGVVGGLAMAGLLGWDPASAGGEDRFAPDLAVQVLTSLAGASITVVGVVFSITMLVLSSASAQFGPRLLNRFLQRISTKITIGGFVGSFSYQLLVASSLAQERPVGDLAIWIGILGGLTAFGLLLGFLHSVVRFIQVPFVVDEITGLLTSGLENFAGHGDEAIHQRKAALTTTGETETALHSEKDGFLQQIETDAICKLARQADAAVFFQARAGQFVAKNDVIATIRSTGSPGNGFYKKARSLVAVGPERTAQQDIEFALRQLVEIATKALSPSINDPHTAITVIWRVAGALRCIVDKALPAGLWYDGDGVMRLSIPVPRADGILSGAYDSLRQFGAPIPAVATAHMESLAYLAKSALHPDFANALEKQVELLKAKVEQQDWLSAEILCFEVHYRSAVSSLEKLGGTSKQM